MADIYANSYLTISAASCQNKQEGFIKATAFEPSARLTTIPGTQGQYIYVRPCRFSAPPTPLIDRAWAFQERLLSRHVLHLTSLEMLFQCDRQQSGDSRMESLYHGCGQKLFLWDNWWPTFIEKTINRLWYQVVEDYAHLGLTYETDRLPALSSIASIIQQRLLKQGWRANYVAGLWDNDLPYGLLWSERISDNPKARERSAYVAPTWSWASIRGEVKYPAWGPPPHLLKLNVVEAQSHPSTSNPFGEISSAWLVVDAPLRRFLTRDTHVLAERELIRSFPLSLEPFEEAEFWVDIGNHEIPTSRMIWLLPCVMDTTLEDTEMRTRSDNGYHGWDGLVLELVDEKKQAYKRIGVFHTNRVFTEERTWHALGFVDTRVTIV